MAIRPFILNTSLFNYIIQVGTYEIFSEAFISPSHTLFEAPAFAPIL